MSKFDDWYENNPTSCDAKKSHVEGRIFILKWVSEEIGSRSPECRLGYTGPMDELKTVIEEELKIMKDEI